MEAPNIVLTQVTSAAAFAYILQLLQQWEKLPWITAHTARINAVVRILLSGVAALGVNWAWSGSTSTGWHLGVDIPSLAALGHGLWNWFGQYAIQHGWLKVFQLPGAQATTAKSG